MQKYVELTAVAALDGLLNSATKPRTKIPKSFFMLKFYTKFLDAHMTQCDKSFNHFVELFNDECSFSKDF